MRIAFNYDIILRVLVLRREECLRITSITVNGKNAYVLKGKFHDDLHKNAFSGTNGEDAVKHIKYFLKIVDPIDLQNVNHDKLRVVVFPISLVGDAWRWFDRIKGSITRFKTYDEYKDDWIYEWNKNVPWVHEKPLTDTRVWTEPAPVMHCSRPFNYKSGFLEWPTCSWREDGYCNGGNLPRAYIVGNTLIYQDLEWYEALKDSELKEEALRNKAIMEGLIDEDDESSNNDNQISIGQDEEYVASKEDECEDLTNTSKNAIHAYREIFRIMDEGWKMKSLDAPLLLQTWFADEEETVDKENTNCGTKLNYITTTDERTSSPIENEGKNGRECAASEWFTKECIGSITTWDNMVKKFIMKFLHLSDHDEEEETEEDDNPNETDNLNNDIAKGTEEPWLENRVPYQLCDHVCEPYRLKNGETKWPMCTSDIDGFCNGGELPGMVRLKNYFENFHELDYEVLVKLQECWWKVNAHEITPFTYMENFGRGPYANMKTKWTSNPYLNVNRICGRNYEASNVGETQENQGHEEHKATIPVKKVKGLDLVKILTTDELWFGISDHDAVRVCLLLVSTIVFVGREKRFYIPDNILELVEDLLDYKSAQPSCVCSFEYFSNLDEPGPRDCVGDVLAEVVELEQKLISSGVDTAEIQMQVDSNNHYDVHAVEQDSPCPNMVKDVNINSDVQVEDQNSPLMDKEDLLAEFDGIKATVHIIDKRKGEVATSYLEKVLDLVKDKIAVIEKALKLRYQDSSEDSVQQVFYNQHELGGSKSVSALSDVFHQVVASKTHVCPGEGSGLIYADSQDTFCVLQLLQLASNEKSRPAESVGFDNMLDPSCKDELAADNDQEGLVKLVVCNDEKVVDEKAVDKKGQASPRLTAKEVQQPPSEVCVDVHVDHVQSAQKPLLNDFIVVCFSIIVLKF
ncbi:hypothetical protein Tco_0236177 [Tanacetum coccineum]